jgi:hypothetical protein
MEVVYKPKSKTKKNFEIKQQIALFFKFKRYETERNRTEDDRVCKEG